MKIVGFQSGHDVSYCILENGIPIIHEELERFSREKEPPGCGLKFFFERNKDVKDIAGFAFGNYLKHFDNPLEEEPNPIDKASFKRAQDMSNGNMAYFPHHLSHAANAFYTSPHKNSLIVTVDGGGNRPLSFQADDGTIKRVTVPESLTINWGEDTNISFFPHFQKELFIDGLVMENHPDLLVRSLNLGKTWNNVTNAIFGLSIGYPKGNQAGTVMAMATLGDPKYLDLFNDTMWDPSNPNYNVLAEYAAQSEEEGFNVAASLQKYTENTFFDIIAPYIEETKCDTICFSGGVSLNCVMLGKIKNKFPTIKNVFCDPVPYDGGLSLGAARLMWHGVLQQPRIYDNIANRSPYLGCVYSETDVLKAIEAEKKTNCVLTTDSRVLELLNEQNIISVFGGGAESGRRALGNRSILADPRSSTMKDIINHKIKHRQWYRPFAPSILLEYVDEWFEENYYSPYMSFAPKFKKDKRNMVPAVVHTDGTGRLQTVDKKLNPWYHSFISEWYKISGVPILLNTSFNDREPIVETPQHAIKCFLKTDIDYLYFYDYGLLVEKTN